MKNFLRKYWTHILNILYLLTGIVLFIILGINEDAFGFPVIIILLVLTLFLWFEIIWHIVVIARNKEDDNRVLHAILSYILNIFYIPCYRLKYIVKDENHKVKNIVYIVGSILLYIVMYVVMMVVIFINVYNDNTYDYDKKIKNDNSIYESLPQIKYFDNGRVSITLPSNYKIKESDTFDYYAISDDATLGIFVYENYNYTGKEILDIQTDSLMEKRENPQLISSNTYKSGSKAIMYNVYNAEYEKYPYTYVLTSIEFDNKPNYIIYAMQITYEENYDSKKVEMKKILESIELKF